MNILEKFATKIRKLRTKKFYNIGPLDVIMLKAEYRYTECHFVECHYTECRWAHQMTGQNDL